MGAEGKVAETEAAGPVSKPELGELAINHRAEEAWGRMDKESGQSLPEAAGCQMKRQ